MRAMSRLALSLLLLLVSLLAEAQSNAVADSLAGTKPSSRSLKRWR
ncbi:MAG: hypothetical protein LUC33_01520 [Prevotellaceae bacterium]|nr:hypothetical protein [Prevotellaceae bacterium]